MKTDRQSHGGLFISTVHISKRDVVDKDVTSLSAPHLINTKIPEDRFLIAKPVFILTKDAPRGVLSLNMPR
jgi:hypothetical protein